MNNNTLINCINHNLRTNLTTLILGIEYSFGEIPRFLLKKTAVNRLRLVE
jgi:hypothetical protein